MKQKPRKKSLTERMLMYQATGAQYSALHEQTAIYIYNYLQRCSLLNEDLKSEFFLSLYPSFEAIIRNFKFIGIPFEQYVVFIAKKRLKSFLKQAQKSSFLWTMFQTPGFEINMKSKDPDEDAASDTDFQRILQINESGKITNPAAKKRFLCFAMKQARNHSENEIQFIAHITDTSPEWIQLKVDEIRSKLVGQENRLKYLTRRRNKLFITIRCIEYKLNRECDRDKRKDLFSRLAKKKATLEFVVDAIRHIPLAPTHQEIGEVLDIPKGTVDIQMYRLKKRITSALQSA
jgi:hypothetical protein